MNLHEIIARYVCNPPTPDLCNQVLMSKEFYNINSIKVEFRTGFISTSPLSTGDVIIYVINGNSGETTSQVPQGFYTSHVMLNSFNGNLLWITRN